MYKNWTATSARKYLIGVCALFVGFFILSFLFITAINSRSEANYHLSAVEILLMSLGFALVPTASFTGFCVGFIRIDKLSKNQILLIVLLCVPIVIFAVPFGLFMIPPTIVNCIKIIQRS